MLLALPAAACGGDGEERPFALVMPGVLTVATDIPYAPFEFIDPATGEPTGFDVELVRAVAAAAGIDEVRFVVRPFDAIIPEVRDGLHDVGASSISITPARAELIDFSSSYFTANQSLMVRRGSPITAVGDLAGVRVGVQRGTTGEQFAATTGARRVVAFDDITGAFDALERVVVEAVVNDFAISAYAAIRHPQLTVVARVATEENYGFAFSKANPGLRAAFDRGLAGVVADGTYQEIYRTWFGGVTPG